MSLSIASEIILSASFATLKENKCIAARLDKLDAIFLAFISLALLLAFQLFS